VLVELVLVIERREETLDVRVGGEWRRRLVVLKRAAVTDAPGEVVLLGFDERSEITGAGQRLRPEAG
jgi:hypothetical protein